MANKKILSITVLGILLASLALSVGIVSADDTIATQCTLHVQDELGNDNIEFLPTEKVFISWVANGIVDIKITNDATDDVVWSMDDAPATGSNVEVGLLPPGDYTVTVYGVNRMLAEKIVNVDTFFVVPESAFGALAAIGTGLAAFGSVAIIKRKRA